MTYVLIAIVCGFIGGVLASMVLYETLETLYIKKMQSDEEVQNEMQKRTKSIDEQYNAVTVALQELTYRFVRERGALWESVNALWNDYDARHKAPEEEKAPEPEPEQTQGDAEPAKEAATDTKAKKKEKHTKNDG